MPHLRHAAWIGLVLCLVAGGAAPAAEKTNRFSPLVQAIKRTRPAVVNIHSQKTVAAQSNQTASASGRMSGMGTGVIVDARGYIVTNSHVIDDVSSLRVTLVDGATYAAEPVMRDPQSDLALLRIQPIAPLAVMPIGASEDLMLGENVIAIGNAFGYEDSITQGIISALHRDVRLSEEQSYHNLIQTDTAINPGNSGGPLINADGEMIGLNVAIRAGAQGIGFAIPADDVKQILAKLLSIRKLRGTWHGVVGKTAELADRERGRVIVRRVETGSPAEAAGLQTGDRLLSVGDLRLSAAYDLERALLDKKAGDRVAVAYLRGGAERAAQLTVASAPAKAADPVAVIWRRLGVKLSVAASNTEVRKISVGQQVAGLKITEVASQGPAEQVGLRVSDVLVGLDERETLTLDNVMYMLRQPAAAGSQSMKFHVVRNGNLHWGFIQLLPDE